MNNSIREPGLFRKLSGKVALITGGTSGIGEATATLFAAEGADMVITGRRVGLGEKIVKGLSSYGTRAAFVEADHSKLEDCDRAIKETVSRFGRIDILFNNAGVVMNGTAETTSEEDWSYVLNLNLTAVWRMSRLVLPHMRAGAGGVIVNNASDWGVVGAENALAYAVSKAAVVQLTRCMALDLATRKHPRQCSLPRRYVRPALAGEGLLRGLGPGHSGTSQSRGGFRAADETFRQAGRDRQGGAVPGKQ